MLVKILLALVVVVNGVFVFNFVRDLLRHKEFLKEEPGNPIAMVVYATVVFLLSTFGISDFAIGTSLLPKFKWVSTERLPGTLNTECVVPVAVMALCYISVISCDPVTLIVAILCQVVGSYVSPRFVVKLPANKIKIGVCFGLIVVALIILAGKLGVYPSGGEATGFAGAKLVVFGALMFLYGALNNIGIGSYALTQATVYAMGLSPAVAFPIMMGACTFSVPVGSMQFIKLDSYSRKQTFFTSIFGCIGVLIAVFIVKSMDTELLKWIVLVVIVYSVVTMLMSMKKTEASASAE